MSNNKTFRNVYIAFLALFIITFLNITYTTITGKHLFSGENIAQYKKDRDTKVENISAQRGTIYDRNGEIIAKDSNTYTLIAYLSTDRVDSARNRPGYVTNAKEYAKKLAPILKAKEKDLFKLLSQKNLYQTELGIKGKGLNINQKEKIEKLDLPGIEFNTTISRYYPNGVFASSTIGYATYDEKEKRMVGQLGVEATYDDYLRGDNGYRKYEVDGNGYLRRELENKATKNGSDVYLTIDSNIQRILESNMEELVKKNKPEMALAVVADAKTNEILALSNRPTFNPNVLDIKDFNNPFVSLQFEPGSTMKTFTYASAMDLDVYKGKVKFNSNSVCIVYNGICVQKINNYNNLSWGNISYDEGYMRSSNTGIISLFNKYLDVNSFEKYLDKFHFFKKTGIEIAGEARGSKQMSIKQEKYTTGFGQSSATTPVQMIQAFSAITNNGKMMKPYITSKIVDENKVVKEFKPTKIGDPISSTTAKDMLKLMSKVVEDPRGTGYTYYRIDDYKIAGKTGTAEYVENGRYLTCSTCYYNSFLSAAPASNPDIIVYLITKKENGNGAAQYEARGKLIRNVTSNTLAYLNSKPDKKKVSNNTVKNIVEVESFINKSIAYTKKKLDNNKMTYIIIGDGDVIVNQSATPYTKISNEQRIFLLTNAKSFKMHDLKNYSKADVLKYTNLLNIPVEFEGSGYVSSQNIKPGTKLNSKSKLKVKLK